MFLSKALVPMSNPLDLAAIARDVGEAIAQADVGVTDLRVSRVDACGWPLLRVEWLRFELTHSAEFAEAYLAARADAAAEIVAAMIGALRYRRH